MGGTNLSFLAVRTVSVATGGGGEAWRRAEPSIVMQAAPRGATAAGTVTVAGVGRKLAGAASIDTSAMSGTRAAERLTREHIFPAYSSQVCADGALA